jgi:type III pantothenate kinase
MKLLIDYGNTLIKIAMFAEDKLIELRTFSELDAVHLKLLLPEMERKYPELKPVKYAILAGVRDIPEGILKFLSENYEFLVLDLNTPLPISIRYETPETLGQDRIALAVAGAGLFPDKNILVIDAGTCITYDFVNDKKEYWGGGISPGISMRFRALHTFTGKLPFIDEFEETLLVGSTTKNSIVSGVLNGVLAEVENIMERYKREYSIEKVMFTGGDMIYFDKKLKNVIFANSNLVLTGLNMILNYNVGK